jgi:hypothetical protein
MCITFWMEDVRKHGHMGIAERITLKQILNK